MKESRISEKSAKRLRKLAKIIVRHFQHFDLSEWASEIDCHTVGCVAAFAVIEFSKKEYKSYDSGLRHLSKYPHGGREARMDYIKQKATEYLGLTFSEANNIFYAYNWPTHYEKEHHVAASSLERAVVVAEYLNAIADGRVDISTSVWATVVG